MKKYLLNLILAGCATAQIPKPDDLPEPKVPHAVCKTETLEEAVRFADYYALKFIHYYPDSKAVVSVTPLSGHGWQGDVYLERKRPDAIVP